MIYINGRFLTRPMTGVERFAYRVCTALADIGQDFIVICPKTSLQSCYDVSNLHIVYFGYGYSHFWEQCVLPFFFLRKKEYIIFSFTGLGPIILRNTVMTIHDLSFLENPKWFSKSYYCWYKLMTPLAVRMSKHIITVSEFSKKEILHFYPFVNPKRITVVYGAVDLNRFKNPGQEIFQTEDYYILTVSSLDPRKNLQRLIQAFKDIDKYKLYIVGAHNRVFASYTSQQQEYNNIKFMGHLSDIELIQLYNNATCFVFPSLYEGFGLPPIEAMSFGCPTLVADIPVTREVCGDAALYFDPYDTNNIHNTIIQYLNNKDVLKEKMQKKGYANVKQFSWKSSAISILKIANETRR